MQGRTPLLETLRELECEIRLLTVYARECVAAATRSSGASSTV